MDSSTIAVLGAGSWGTALAILLARNGRDTVLWGHTPEHVRELSEHRENRRFLPGHPFPPALRVGADLAEVADACRDHLVAVPSHGFRGLVHQLVPLLQPGSRIAWATKGLEPGTGKLLHQVVYEELGDLPAAVLSGPTFAKEVAAGLPTAITVASHSPHYAAELAGALRNDSFRPYTARDLVGVQVGGAVKNVLAIAAGISDGLGFGANARAALITRGLAEIMRLGLSLGGKSETFMGLAGLGDLVLTCTDDLSRNRRCGLLLGQGVALDAALERIGQAVEGVTTVSEVVRLSQARQVEMPITDQVYGVLFQGHDPRAAVRELLRRQPRDEF